MRPKSIYLIGSLRNPNVPGLASFLRQHGFDVFDDWYAAGPNADDCWRDYEQGRGHTMATALRGYAARHVFDFDCRHLNRCDFAVLYMPAGKSGHLELGWFIGKGKPGFVLFDEEPDRFDVMYQFAAGVFYKREDLVQELDKYNYLASNANPVVASHQHPVAEFGKYLQASSSQ